MITSPMCGSNDWMAHRQSYNCWESHHVIGDEQEDEPVTEIGMTNEKVQLTTAKDVFCFVLKLKN